MKKWIGFLSIIALAICFIPQRSDSQTRLPISENTEACLTCHSQLHPGIVAEWKKSRHGNITPAEALKKPTLERRISNEKVPDEFSKTVIGCAECHMMNSEKQHFLSLCCPSCRKNRIQKSLCSGLRSR